MDVARYSCVAGYVLSGAAERTCQADQQWNGSVPACESEMLQCSVQLCFCVGPPLYKSVDHAANGTIVRTYVCMIDTPLVSAMFMCMSISVGDTCVQPAAPGNGRVDTSAGTSFGDVVRYACDTGYMLSGVAERTCQADKRWSGSVPTCASE